MVVKQFEWVLPKGDMYEVWKKTEGRFVYYSCVRREEETTMCCHGTNSMNTITEYYYYIHQCQKDIMNDITNSELHTYWKNYRERQLLRLKASNITS